MLQTFQMGKQKKVTLRLVVCSEDMLAEVILEQRLLMVVVRDPHREENGSENIPFHAFKNIQDSLILSFADIEPEAYQDRWQDPVEPWLLPPSELIMGREHGKKLWAFLMKQRGMPPEVFVFVGDKRAVSVAHAVRDVMRLPSGSIYLANDPENKCEGPGPNKHVWQMSKLGREMVVT